MIEQIEDPYTVTAYFHALTLMLLVTNFAITK